MKGVAMTTTVKTAEVKEDVKIDEAAHAEKAGVIDRIKNSRPAKFINRHRVGVAAGVGTAIAAGAAVVIAAKNGYVDGVDDALSTVGDAVGDAVENVTEA